MAQCGSCHAESRYEDLTNAFGVLDKTQYAADSIVSTTIIDNDNGTLTLFAFDAGEKLSTHSAPFDAVVHVVDGEAEVTIGEKTQRVSAGQMVVMPANIPHAVSAPTRFKMVLSLFRP